MTATSPLLNRPLRTLEQAMTDMRRKYRPSNGTEGADFMEAFCDRCKHDAEFRAGTGDSCPIVADTLTYKISDPEYPKEWVLDADGYALCTAFDPEDD